jgi:hypothetical protein
VRVHCDEGVAIHIGPKPCADVREGVDEASAGEPAGQPLSLDSVDPGCRRRIKGGRQHDHRRFREPAVDLAGSENLACSTLLVDGNREISGLTGRVSGPARIGKARSRSR